MPSAATRKPHCGAGVPVDRHIIILYTMSALTAGIAGVLHTARFTGGSSIAGDPLLLSSIAAVIIGGVSMFGGSGRISGTIIGSLIIAILTTGLVMLNVEPFWQFVVVGVVVILAVLIDQSRDLIYRAASRSSLMQHETYALCHATWSSVWRPDGCRSCQPGCLSWRSSRLAWRQRRRQVHADQVCLRCVSRRRRRIYFRGQIGPFSRPIEARHAGIETIYQDLALASNLDVSGNIFLGREIKKRRLGGLVHTLDNKSMLHEAETALDTLDIHFPDLTQPIENLSGGQRQAVAIARALYWNARLMIMDEPTNNLGVPEQRKVLDLINKLREQKVPVILISHTLPDVFAAADRLVVMHRGRKVTEKRTAETDTQEIVQYMVGALDDTRVA